MEGLAIANNSEKGPHLWAIWNAVSPFLLLIDVSTKGWFNRMTRVSKEFGLEAARWRGVNPPLVRALTFAPQSKSNKIHWLLCHLLAECKGCHDSFVWDEIFAPLHSNSLAISTWFS